MGEKLYKISIRLLLASVFIPGLLWRCANQMAPQGGPRDSLPPRVAVMSPKYGATNFSGKRIAIEFDEFIQIKDQQKEFFTSPLMEKSPSISLRGRGIQIDLRDTLLPNQTYALNFCNAIRDNNESNILSGFRYVFSTGGAIDSMLMSGYAADAYTRDSVPGAFIFFYPAETDSIPGYDSLMFRSPAAVARATPRGIFIAENLKPVPYRVYALDDRNGSKKYEPGMDKVAFLDSVFNPASMPGFSIRYDTLRKYNVADPQLYFRLFMDEGFRRQYLSRQARPEQHQIILSFAAKYPQIESVRFHGLDSSRIMTQYLKPTRDSICYWLDIPSEELPDTIRGEVTFMKHDSLNRLQSVTDKLVLGWRSFEPKKKDKDKNDTLPPPNPFAYRVDASATLNPFKNIPLSFTYPLASIDSASVSLTRVESEEKKYRARFRFRRDTADMRNWILSSAWVAGAKYELVIPAGALKNIAGQANDTLKASFTVATAEKYASLELDILGKTPESKYIIELLPQSGNNVIRAITGVRTGKLEIPFLDPGVVRIRITEDVNGNGKWDSGSLIARQQPERAEIYTMPEGGTEITTKENWTLDFKIDMNEIFAPVTMQSVMEQIGSEEAARLQRIMKAQAEKSGHRNTTPNSSGIGISSGLNSTISKTQGLTR